MSEKQLRNEWGTDEQYYKELEAFYKQHKGAATLVMDTELNCPIKAEYYFRPRVSYLERLALMEELTQVVEDCKSREALEP